MDLHVHIHHDDDRILAELAHFQERMIMALDDLKAALASAAAQLDTIAVNQAETGTALTEIGSDLQTLIDRLANGEPGSADVAEATAAAQALVARLQGVADTSTAQAQAAKDAAAQFTA